MSREMKDSGIEWIGEIPKGWEVVRIKNASWLKGRIGWQGLKSSEYQDEGAYLITGTDFKNGYINWDTCVHISKKRFDEDADIHIQEDDLLITKDGTIGKVAIAKNCPKEVSLNSGVLLIRNERAVKYIDKYLYYTLLSDEFWTWFNSSLTGSSTIIHLYQEQFYNFSFALPSLLSEQQKIANHLDIKCAEIDNLISLQEEMIAELKAYKQSVITEAVCKGLDKNVPMKDSGVEWIGEIPEKWSISKIKNEFEILDYLREPISAENRKNELGLYDYYGASGVIDKIDDYNVDDKVLLIGEDGANLVMRNLPLIYRAEGKFWVNNHAHILKPIIKNEYDYMAYLLEAGDYILYITGSAQPKLSQDKLKNFIIPIPDNLTEQQTIANYLDKKCANIDQLISIKQQKADELKEYKKSMIYEYVTGKKEVI